MFNIIKVAFYIALSIIAFYFVMANVSLMKHGNRKEILTDSELDGGYFSNMNIPNNQKKIENELEAYGQQLINRNSQKSKEIKDQITQKITFKQKQEKQDPKEGLLNSFLKYVSPVSNLTPKAPDLENYDDYAPTDTPVDNKNPILSTNTVVPHYLDVTKDAYYNKSTPLAINEFDTHRPANFTSERRAPWFDKLGGDNLSFFFKSNPFKSFDDISKADVVDPSEWDRIAKKKEAGSPLLSLDCMKPEKNGFMPSNHYDVGKRYSVLC